jgi:glycosyltransferase involved in cell wall biosynthesis
LAQLDRYVLGFIPHSSIVHGSSLRGFLERIQAKNGYSIHFHRYPYFLFAVPSLRDYACYVDIDDSPHSAVQKPCVQDEAFSILPQIKKYLFVRYNHRICKYFDSLYSSKADKLFFVSRNHQLCRYSTKCALLPNVAYLSRSTQLMPWADSVSVLSDLTQPDSPTILGFMGSMAHQPNIDALTFFLREVWPFYQNTGRFQFIIAGAGIVPKSLMVLMESCDAIEFMGFVGNVSEFFSRIHLFVAPISWGAGSNVKVVEALAWGVPVAGSDFALASAIEIGFEPFLVRLNSAESWHNFFQSSNQLRSIAALKGTFSGLTRMRELWESVLLDSC